MLSNTYYTQPKCERSKNIITIIVMPGALFHSNARQHNTTQTKKLED